MTQGYIKLNRSEETKELLQHPNEYLLLSLIAYRAKRTNSFSTLGLEPGEALIGDHESCGLTRQKYRTALKNLKSWKFLTTKSTNKGTIVKLTDSRVFDINIEEGNHQINQRVTTSQPPANHQPTTNKNIKKEKNEKNGKNNIPYKEIISYLNEKTGKNFRYATKQTQKHIWARWKDGFRLEDFHRVIDNKSKDLYFQENPKFYRPETLFGNKFESYFNETPHPLHGEVSKTSLKNRQNLADWEPPNEE